MLTKYVLKAYVSDKPQVAPVEAVFLPKTNTDNYVGKLSAII
jgi:hypothetical protein